MCSTGCCQNNIKVYKIHKKLSLYHLFLDKSSTSNFVFSSASFLHSSTVCSHSLLVMLLNSLLSQNKSKSNCQTTLKFWYIIIIKVAYQFWKLLNHCTNSLTFAERRRFRISVNSGLFSFCSSKHSPITFLISSGAAFGIDSLILLKHMIFIRPKKNLLSVL